jgi:quercetin dioxygenase-like cupin family protein
MGRRRDIVRVETVNYDVYRNRGVTIMKRRFLILLLALLVSCTTYADDTVGVITEVLAKTGNSWDGSTLPAYPDKSPEITILRITIPCGTTLPIHLHPVINAGVLLSGELTVITEGDKTLQLKAGDPVVEVVNKWHYGKNTGNDPAVILVFYAGAIDTPITIKK